MIKVCVFGANGQTGKQILAQSKSFPIAIKAAVRNESSLEEFKRDFEIVTYTFDNPELVKKAMRNCDIVVSAIGSGSYSDAAKPTTLYSDAAKTLLQCAKEEGVKKIIIISSAGVEYDAKAPWYYRYFFRPWLMNSYMDMMKMETILEEHKNEIDWTIVRPTYLLDGEHKPYLVKNRKVGEGNFKIFRVDVAQFILKECNQNDWNHKYPTLGYS